jgi:hypothetical protein
VGIRVGIARGVFVTKDAKVVAMASSMGTLGVALVLLGREQAVKVTNKKIIKKYLMRRLYSFSEQFDIYDV